jgi:endonuclease YncB( thermonuclease family)
MFAWTLANGEEIRGKVISVADGDTITVLTADKQQHRIRLAGIDAPEKGQAFGNRSKQNLVSLALNKEAQLDCYKTDRYKRKVCRVTAETRDVALEQVRAGLAWWYRRYANEQTREEQSDYEQAQAEARSTGVGLWRDREPLPPWGWRAKNRRDR